MADTQNASAANGKDISTVADALDMLDANPGMLGSFLDIDIDDDQPQDTGGKPTVDEDHGDSQSDDDETDDQDLAAEEDDQAEEQSDEESEADGDFKLFTIGEDGKQEAVDIDDLEIPVEIDGEDQLLAVDELRKGYLRQADYTRKTQAISEKVAEEIETEREKLSADFSERMQAIDGIEAVFGKVFDQEPTLEQLTAQYGGDKDRAWAALKQWKGFSEQIGKAKELQKRRAAEDQQRELGQIQATITRTIKSLRETVPEWKDKAKFDADSADMRAFMLKNGLDDDDIVQILQKSGHVLLIRDAMYGQQLRQKKGAVAKRRKAAPKTVNRSAGNLHKPDAGTRKQAQLRKRVQSGTATKADAIAMIEASLPDDF